MRAFVGHGSPGADIRDQEQEEEEGENKGQGMSGRDGIGCLERPFLGESAHRPNPELSINTQVLPPHPSIALLSA